MMKHQYVSSSQQYVGDEGRQWHDQVSQQAACYECGCIQQLISVYDPHMHACTCW
jgi:hypothetical protein